jgi:hypothetical protein
VASEGDRRPDLEVEARRSRVLEGLRLEAEGARGVAIALASTVVFLTAVVVAVTQSPGWPEVHRVFFGWHDITSSFPEIARAFVLNVKVFLVCETFILVFALLIAVLRSLPGPVFFPLRALAIIYADLARGVPTILVIALLGFGAPALQLSGVPTSRVFWLAGTPVGDSSAGDQAGHPAAAERLHRVAEGHCARRDARRRRGVQPVADRRKRDVHVRFVPRRGRVVRRDHDSAGALHRLVDCP